MTSPKPQAEASDTTIAATMPAPMVPSPKTTLPTLEPSTGTSILVMSPMVLRLASASGSLPIVAAAAIRTAAMTPCAITEPNAVSHCACR